MSVLDKKFIYEYLNPIPQFKHYGKFIHYMKHGIKEMFKTAEVLDHKFHVTFGEESCFIMYKLEHNTITYYMHFELYVGSCEGCIFCCDNNYDKVIYPAIDRMYVTTSKEDVYQFHEKQINKLSEPLNDILDDTDEDTISDNLASDEDCEDEIYIGDEYSGDESLEDEIDRIQNLKINDELLAAMTEPLHVEEIYFIK